MPVPVSTRSAGIRVGWSVPSAGHRILAQLMREGREGETRTMSCLWLEVDHWSYWITGRQAGRQADTCPRTSEERAHTMQSPLPFLRPFVTLPLFSPSLHLSPSHRLTTTERASLPPLCPPLRQVFDADDERRGRMCNACRDGMQSLYSTVPTMTDTAMPGPFGSTFRHQHKGSSAGQGREVRVGQAKMASSSVHCGSYASAIPACTRLATKPAASAHCHTHYYPSALLTHGPPQLILVP